LKGLFDTERGHADPVNLAKAIADTAVAAAGDPATLNSLLRQGGMDHVLKVMPASATLHDVVVALGHGGLAAAVEVVYPTSHVAPVVALPVTPVSPVLILPTPGSNGLGDLGGGSEPTTLPGGLPPGLPPGFPINMFPFPIMKTGVEFHLDDTPGAIKVLTNEGPVTDLLNYNALSLTDLHFGAGSQNLMQTLGAPPLHFSNGNIVLDTPVPTSVYDFGAGAGGLSTVFGPVQSFDIAFAGGTSGHFHTEGFEVTLLDLASNTSLYQPMAPLAYMFNPSSTVTGVETGGGRDVLALSSTTVDIRFDLRASSAQDLVLGFKAGVDTVSLIGNLGAAVDTDHDNEITWATGGVITNVTEAVEVTTHEDVYNMLDNPAHTALTLTALNHACDVSTLAPGAHLLILVNDGVASDGAALYLYKDMDQNGHIDAADLTVIATFADGMPTHADIHLVGVPS
jgi:hypothetical protein